VQEGVVGLKWVGDRGSVDAERGWEVGSAGEAKEGFRLTGGDAKMGREANNQRIAGVKVEARISWRPKRGGRPRRGGRPEGR